MSHARLLYILRHIVISLSLLLTACGSMPKLSPHKIAIQQGNLITQPMVDRLKPGMSKRQVEFVLGTPLIADTLQQDQWHYVYSLKLGNGQKLKKQLAVYFDQDKLSHLEGDFQLRANNAP